MSFTPNIVLHCAKLNGVETLKEQNILLNVCFIYLWVQLCIILHGSILCARQNSTHQVFVSSDFSGIPLF